jgi:hypothetical protein
VIAHCIAIAVAAAPRKITGGSEGDEVLENACIVRAIATKIAVVNKLKMATLAINKVLYGDETVKGMVLTLPVYEIGGLGALILHPPLKQGEEGVWLVRRVDGTLIVDVVTMQTWPDLKLPARQALSDKDFKLAVQWADDVASLHKADRALRKDMLEKYRIGKNARTVAWATQCLKRLEAKEKRATDKSRN